jgi:hypothetical protein
MRRAADMVDNGPNASYLGVRANRAAMRIVGTRAGISVARVGSERQLICG